MGETSVQASECCPCSVTKPCLTRCDPIDCSAPASSVLCSLQSLLRFTSIELVMPSDHLMLPARFTVSKFPPPSHQTLTRESVGSSPASALGIAPSCLPSNPRSPDQTLARSYPAFPGVTRTTGVLQGSSGKERALRIK